MPVYVPQDCILLMDFNILRICFLLQRCLGNDCSFFSLFLTASTFDVSYGFCFGEFKTFNLMIYIHVIHIMQASQRAFVTLYLGIITRSKIAIWTLSLVCEDEYMYILTCHDRYRANYDYVSQSPYQASSCNLALSSWNGCCVPCGPNIFAFPGLCFLSFNQDVCQVHLL